ncbi:hypothetical protein ABK040_007558 [Willaertia magna]
MSDVKIIIMPKIFSKKRNNEMKSHLKINNKLLFLILITTTLLILQFTSISLVLTQTTSNNFRPFISWLQYWKMNDNALDIKIEDLSLFGENPIQGFTFIGSFKGSLNITRYEGNQQELEAQSSSIHFIQNEGNYRNGFLFKFNYETFDQNLEFNRLEQFDWIRKVYSPTREVEIIDLNMLNFINATTNEDDFLFVLLGKATKLSSSSSKGISEETFSLVFESHANKRVIQQSTEDKVVKEIQITGNTDIAVNFIALYKSNGELYKTFSNTSYIDFTNLNIVNLDGNVYLTTLAKSSESTDIITDTLYLINMDITLNGGNNIIKIYFDKNNYLSSDYISSFGIQVNSVTIDEEAAFIYIGGTCRYTITDDSYASACVYKVNMNNGTIIWGSFGSGKYENSILGIEKVLGVEELIVVVSPIHIWENVVVRDETQRDLFYIILMLDTNNGQVLKIDSLADYNQGKLKRLMIDPIDRNVLFIQQFSFYFFNWEETIYLSLPINMNSEFIVLEDEIFVLGHTIGDNGTVLCDDRELKPNMIYSYWCKLQPIDSLSYLQVISPRFTIETPKQWNIFVSSNCSHANRLLFNFGTEFISYDADFYNIKGLEIDLYDELGIGTSNCDLTLWEIDNIDLGDDRELYHSILVTTEGTIYRLDTNLIQENLQIPFVGISNRKDIYFGVNFRNSTLGRSIIPKPIQKYIYYKTSTNSQLTPCLLIGTTCYMQIYSSKPNRITLEFHGEYKENSTHLIGRRSINIYNTGIIMNSSSRASLIESSITIRIHPQFDIPMLNNFEKEIFCVVGKEIRKLSFSSFVYLQGYVKEVNCGQISSNFEGITLVNLFVQVNDSYSANIGDSFIPYYFLGNTRSIIVNNILVKVFDKSPFTLSLSVEHSTIFDNSDILQVLYLKYDNKVSLIRNIKCYMMTYCVLSFTIDNYEYNGGRLSLQLLYKDYFDSIPISLDTTLPLIPKADFILTNKEQFNGTIIMDFETSTIRLKFNTDYKFTFNSTNRLFCQVNGDEPLVNRLFALNVLDNDNGTYYCEITRFGLANEIVDRLVSIVLQTGIVEMDLNYLEKISSTDFKLTMLDRSNVYQILPEYVTPFQTSYVTVGANLTNYFSYFDDQTLFKLCCQYGITDQSSLSVRDMICDGVNVIYDKLKDEIVNCPMTLIANDDTIDLRVRLFLYYIPKQFYYNFGETRLKVKNFRVSCDNEKCHCNEGYNGTYCENVKCFGGFTNTCSGHGTCILPDVCACMPGYYGERCEKFVKCWLSSDFSYFRCSAPDEVLQNQFCTEYLSLPTLDQVNFDACTIYNQTDVRVDLLYDSYLGSNSSELVYLRLPSENMSVLQVPLEYKSVPPYPDVSVVATQSVGATGEVTLLGVYSKSPEDRTLRFHWELVDVIPSNGNVDPDAKKALADYIYGYGNSILVLQPDILNVSNAYETKYKVQLTVSNIFGNSGTYTSTFSRFSTWRAHVTPDSPIRLSCYRFESCILVIFKRIPPALIGTSTPKVFTTWYSGFDFPLKNTFDAPSALMIDPYTIPFINSSYNVDVTLSFDVDSKKTFVKDSITIIVPQSQLRLHIIGGDCSVQKTLSKTLTVDYEIKDFTDEERGTKYNVYEEISWKCISDNCPDFFNRRLANEKDKQIDVTVSDLVSDKIYVIECKVKVVVECKGFTICKYTYEDSVSTKLEIVAHEIPLIRFSDFPQLLNNENFLIFGSVEYNLQTVTVTNIKSEWQIIEGERVIYSEPFVNRPMLLNSDLLIQGGQYAVRLRTNALTETNNTISAYKDAVFTVALSPDRGSCVLNPTVSKAFDDSMVLECIQFSGLNIKYFIYYFNLVTGGIVDISPSATTSPYALELRLPPLKKIVVRAINHYNSFTEFDMNVNITNPLDNINNITDIVDYFKERMKSLDSSLTSKGYRKFCIGFQALLEMFLLKLKSTTLNVQDAKAVNGVFEIFFNKIYELSVALRDPTCINCWPLYFRKIFSLLSTLYLQDIVEINYCSGSFIESLKQIIVQLNSKLLSRDISNRYINEINVMITKMIAHYNKCNTIRDHTTTNSHLYDLVESFTHLPLRYITPVNTYLFGSNLTDFIKIQKLQYEIANIDGFIFDHCIVHLTVLSAEQLPSYVRAFLVLNYKTVNETNNVKWKSIISKANLQEEVPNKNDLYVLTDLIYFKASTQQFSEEQSNFNEVIEDNIKTNVTVYYKDPIVKDIKNLQKKYLKNYFCALYDPKTLKLKFTSFLFVGDSLSCTFDGVTFNSYVTLLRNDTKEPDINNDHIIAIVTILIVLIVLLLVAVATGLLVCYYLRKKKKKSLEYKSFEDPYIPLGELMISKDQSRYEIIRKVGGGSYGSVFTVKEKLKPEKGELAMKLINITGGSENINVALREAIQLAKLSHKHIVNINECFIWNESNMLSLAIVMPYIKLGHLRKIMKEYAPLSIPIIYKIWLQMVDVLTFLEEKNVIHRDIKPENILISEFNPDNEQINVLLCDFGVANEFSKGSAAATFCGTQTFMAPEIILIDKSSSLDRYDAEADVWSLGCVIYQLFTNDSETVLSSFVIQYGDGENLRKMILQKIKSFNEDYLEHERFEQLLDLLMIMLRKNTERRARPNELFLELSSLQIE